MNTGSTNNLLPCTSKLSNSITRDSHDRKRTF